MRLTPRPPEIGPTDGFTDANDLFGYRIFGERLARLVESVDQELVIALDGPWGSGKSTFAKQWAGLLRNHGGTVIEFDAFENDFSGDAYATVLGEIVAQASGMDLPETDKPKLEAVKQAAKAAIPFASKVAVGLGGRLIGANLPDDLAAVIEDATSDAGDLAAKRLEKLLEPAGEGREKLQAFRRSLSELVSAMSAHSAFAAGSQEAVARRPPLVFIIDELDRCNPSFAVDVVERIKHLFAVEGVVFVLVVNLEHLQAAVERRYGTPGLRYLDKFIHFKTKLPVNLLAQRSTAAVYVDYLFRDLKLAEEFPHPDNYHAQLKTYLVQFADVYDLSLRDIERMVSPYAILLAARPDEKPYPTPLVAGLCYMRFGFPNLYAVARLGELGELNTLDADHQDRVDWEKFQLSFAKLSQGPTNTQWRGYWTKVANATKGSDLLETGPASFSPTSVSWRLIPEMCGYIDIANTVEDTEPAEPS